MWPRMADGIDKPLYDSPNPLPLDDPAYWMLQRGLDEVEGRRENTGWVTETHDEIRKSTCYICNDPEFSLMGMPVCKPCPMCGVHWAADDGECDNGCDIYGYYQDNKLGIFAENGDQKIEDSSGEAGTDQ